MRFYSVFADQSAGGPDALEEAVFVKNGFSWAVFLAFPLWALFHRLWWPLLAWLVASLAVSGLLSLISAPWYWSSLSGLAIALFFAFEAGDLRARRLLRRNHALIGEVHGRSLLECETLFFTDYLQSRERPQDGPDAGGAAPAAA